MPGVGLLLGATVQVEASRSLRLRLWVAQQEVQGVLRPALLVCGPRDFRRLQCELARVTCVEELLEEVPRG